MRQQRNTVRLCVCVRRWLRTSLPHNGEFQNRKTAACVRKQTHAVAVRLLLLCCFVVIRFVVVVARTTTERVTAAPEVTA